MECPKCGKKTFFDPLQCSGCGYDFIAPVPVAHSPLPVSAGAPGTPVARKRPLGVTIVCWILIVVSVPNLLITLIAAGSPDLNVELAKNHMPVAIQKVFGVAGLLVTFLSGAFMLDGARWARSLYVGWGALGSLGTFWNVGFSPKSVAGVITYALFTAVLLAKNSSDFFKRRH